jgi:hypothetical protein
MDRPPGDLRRLDARTAAVRVAPVLVAAALAALYLIWSPPSLDLAAAEYRAWLFGREGFAVWDLQWYAGHHLPGYSVLFPPLAWWLGPRVVGALAVVAAALLFERLVRARYGERAWIGALWFGAGSATSLYSGRITFALGLVPALAALLALQRSLRTRSGRARSALVAAALALAVLTVLASPVAALFLGMAGAAYALAERRAAGLALAACAIGPILVLAVAFPEGGREPFAFSSFWPVLAFTAAALVLVPRGERTLRTGIVLYALGCIGAFVLHTPVGGNAIRLGALCAGPLVALVLWPRRPRALLLLALPLLWWQWTAAVDDVRTASGDRTVQAAYYRPLLAALDRAAAADPARSAGLVGDRVEIPFTRLHWEARQVAPRYPLARGWERQLDIAVNGVFYTGKLTAARYHAWLRRMAVRWVALPDTRLDYSAKQEAKLIRRGLPYLDEIWHDADWRVYAVRDPTPLVSGPAQVTATGSDAIALRAAGPGELLLRVHWTPYWAVAGGDACVSPAGDWTRVDVRRAGRIRLVTRFALGRIGARSPRCAAG